MLFEPHSYTGKRCAVYVRVTIRIELFMGSVSEDTSSHSVLDYCLAAVCSEMDVFHLIYAHTYCEVVF